jgi:biopolymer transport protein ExbD
MRRRRRATGPEEPAEVPMSPLIDCVFLLLIFFLVTTIIKRKEKQITIEMPDSTASVAVEAQQQIIKIGLTVEGTHQLAKMKNHQGVMQWAPIENLTVYLKKQVEDHGVTFFSKPIQISADRNTPFQKAIDTLDLLKLQGFTTVSIKTRGDILRGRL